MDPNRAAPNNKLSLPSRHQTSSPKAVTPFSPVQCLPLQRDYNVPHPKLNKRPIDHLPEQSTATRVKESKSITTKTVTPSSVAHNQQQRSSSKPSHQYFQETVNGGSPSSDHHPMERTATNANKKRCRVESLAPTNKTDNVQLDEQHQKQTRTVAHINHNTAAHTNTNTASQTNTTPLTRSQKKHRREKTRRMLARGSGEIFYATKKENPPSNTQQKQVEPPANHNADEKEEQTVVEPDAECPAGNQTQKKHLKRAEKRQLQAEACNNVLQCPAVSGIVTLTSCSTLGSHSEAVFKACGICYRPLLLYTPRKNPPNSTTTSRVIPKPSTMGRSGARPSLVSFPVLNNNASEASNTDIIANLTPSQIELLELAFPIPLLMSALSTTERNNALLEQAFTTFQTFTAQEQRILKLLGEQLELSYALEKQVDVLTQRNRDLHGRNTLSLGSPMEDALSKRSSQLVEGGKEANETSIRCCCVCGEGEGSLLWCVGCTQYFHELCGGPHHEGKRQLCVECRGPADDSSEEGSDKRRVGSVDSTRSSSCSCDGSSSLDGFIVSDGHIDSDDS